MLELDNINAEMQSSSNYDSDFYKIKEGSNPMRILTDFKMVKSIQAGKVFKGMLTPENQPYVDKLDPKKSDKVSMKAWAWVIIRGFRIEIDPVTNAKKIVMEPENDVLKIVQFGKLILEQLVAYKNSADYPFDKMPMPYDVNVMATKAGTVDVTYVVQPARANKEVTEDEMAKLNKKTPVEAIIQRMKDKQSGKTNSTGNAAAVNDLYNDPKVQADMEMVEHEVSVF